jgi:hypothetical protein
MRAISILKKYITKDAFLKGFNNNNIAEFFSRNIDFYKIARIIPISPNGLAHNYMEFLSYKHGMKECGVEWTGLPYIDYSEASDSCLCFNTPEDAEKYLEKYIFNFKKKTGDNYSFWTAERANKYDHFVDCKYLIVRCVNSFDVEKEYPGLAYNNITNTSEITNNVFKKTSQRRDYK